MLRLAVPDHRARLMLAALNFAGLSPNASGSASEVQTLRRWLDSSPGIGAIEHGMAHQGYDLELTRYANEGWRATFYVTGMAHSIVKGSAWEPTPWRAVTFAGLFLLFFTLVFFTLVILSEDGRFAGCGAVLVRVVAFG